MVEINLRVENREVLVNKVNAPLGCEQGDVAIAVNLLQQIIHDLITAEFSSNPDSSKKEKSIKSLEEEKNHSYFG